MEYLVTSAEMKKADAYAIHVMGMPSMVLMERAALSVVEELEDGSFDLSDVVVVCGSGNNGGDGFAIARLLYLKGVNVRVFFAGEEDRCTEETAQQLRIAKNYGVAVEKDSNLKGCTVIVDALLGIGISKTVQGRFAEIIESINQSGAAVVAVDMPSGISADTGEIMGAAVKAHRTVTFAFRKFGLAHGSGVEYAGKVSVKDIGITADGFEREAQ